MHISMDTCVQYVSSNLSKIPLPDWSHLNVKTKGTIVIPFDQIYIDDITGNQTKVETHTGEEIEALRLSFAGGVDLKEFPPAIVYRGDNYDKPYRLVYGYGRVEAIQVNKQTSWYFTLLEGGEDELEDVQAAENEVLPKRINKEIDMIKFLCDKVRQGKIPNTEQGIRDKFKKIYTNRANGVCGRVVQQVMENLNTPQPYYIYPSTARVKQWLDNHSSKLYEIGGELDYNRDMYGVLCKEGYQYRAVLAAIKRYAETGKFTYIIGHFTVPTSKATLEVKRKQFVNELNDILKSLQSCGLTVFPLKLLGFLPQDRENENLKVLVDPVL
jgi:hypothetical protein